MDVVLSFNDGLAEEEILRTDLLLAKYTGYVSEPAPVHWQDAEWPLPIIKHTPFSEIKYKADRQEFTQSHQMPIQRPAACQ